MENIVNLFPILYPTFRILTRFSMFPLFVLIAHNRPTLVYHKDKGCKNSLRFMSFYIQLETLILFSWYIPGVT
jgi:hypothetical protein